ncbi:hypothetical protein [Stenotrophomonas indicatrix]|uniref:hypothetical protein n=2 Tax=Stenotrophomonas indicatrix TaxID=2045451 RepID=UPI003CE50D1D
MNEKKLQDDLPFNPGADVDDASKSHTPDRLRNDKATWKEHDMPDDGDDPKAAPDDYERPDPDPTGKARPIEANGACRATWRPSLLKVRPQSAL